MLCTIAGSCKKPSSASASSSGRSRLRGPQVVTRHGEDVAVVISIAEYRHLRHEGENFKAFLQSAPDLDLEINRPVSPTRLVSLGDGE